MKRAMTLTALGLLLAGSQPMFGQGGRRDAFFDHSDTGETLHVLPGPASIRSPHDTQPTFATPRNRTTVYAASYGSGNLIDHGGLEIANAGFWAVYWNSSVANSTATSTTTTARYATLRAEINDFINSFPNNRNWDNSTTADYTIVQQYGSHAAIAPTLTNWGAFVDNKAAQSVITDSSLKSYLAGLFNAGRLPARNDTIYGLYLPSGMRVSMQGGMSCSSFCGYHGHFTYGGLQIKYAVFPYLNCSACKLSNLTVADMLTIVTSHEIREAVTDPGDNGVYAWYDSVGYEADDKCAWHYLYQTAQGRHWVQPEYSNGGKTGNSGFTATYTGPGCVVPNQ